MSSNVFDLAISESMGSNKESTLMEADDFSTEGLNVFDVALDKMSTPHTESRLENYARNITRTGSRMVETILGMPGDIYQFGKETSKLLPQIPGDLPSLLRGEKGEANLIQQLGQYLGGKLPTQQSLQGTSESLTEGYTSPQGSGEEFSDEIAKTFAVLFAGSGKPTPGVVGKSPYLKLGRDIGTAIGAESAKEGMKVLGATPTQQELGKLASIFMLGMGLPHITGETSPNAYLSNLYRERDALIPKGTMVQPTYLSDKLKDFVNRTLKRGGPTPEKKQVKNVASEFLEQIEGQSIEMDELLEMYRSINRNRSAVMAARDLDKAGVRAARRYYGELANMFNESIEGYLGSINPRALELNKMANEGWAALAQSQKAQNWIKDVSKGLPLKTGVSLAFGGGAYANPLLAAGTAAGAGLGLKSGEVLYRIMKSPTLRKYYGDVLKNALNEDGPATVRSLQMLDKYYDKEINQ